MILLVAAGRRPPDRRAAACGSHSRDHCTSRSRGRRRVLSRPLPQRSSDPPQLRPLVPHRAHRLPFRGPSRRHRTHTGRRATTPLGRGSGTTGIQVRGEDGELLADFPPNDLASWAGYSVAPAGARTGRIRVTATGPVAALDAFRTGHCPERARRGQSSQYSAVKEPERLLGWAPRSRAGRRRCSACESERGRHAVLWALLSAVVVCSCSISS